MRIPGRFVVGLAALMFFVVGPRPPLAQAGEPVEQFWEPWSQERADKALAEGHPVLVVFSADWCQSCLANEKMFVFTEEVRAAAKKLGAVVLRADFTRADPAILAELKKYGRAGVPLYIVLSPRPGRKPIVLPTVITTQLILDGLTAAAAPTPPYRVLPPDTTRGSIEGTVRLARAVAVPNLQRSRGCARDVPWKERPSEVVAFDPQTLTLKGCVVSLRQVAQGKDWSFGMQRESGTMMLMAHEGLLVPHVRWVRTGTAVTFANEMTHTQLDFKAWFTKPTATSRLFLKFNVMVSAGETLSPSDDTLLDKAGLYTVECHCPGLEHMRAQVLAFDHPYVDGPTGLDGRYVLGDVPPGDYEVVCWHGPFTLETKDQGEGRLGYEYGGPMEVVQQVTVPSGGKVTLDFVLDPPR
jgi:hypothetical protein